MALRKDKVAEALQAMKGICSSPNDPTSLPDALSQLADILGNVFDDIALPELPQIDSGEFGFPEDAPFDFPLGGGGMPGFDPLGGFEGGPPGGGEEFGPGGEGGGEQGRPPPNCEDDVTIEHVTLLAKVTEEIPAAKDGIPGVGDVEVQEIVPENQLKLTECKQKCNDDFAKDISVIDDLIKVSEAAANFGLEDFFNDQVKDLIKQKFEKEKELKKCLAKCRKEDNKNAVGDEVVAGARIENTGQVFSVKNISCEKIEKDTQVVVSGLVTTPPECGDNDLYVMVEACGCCE